MPKVNGKIYYNNITGEVMLVINQNDGPWMRETNFLEDVAMHQKLREVDDDIISVLPLRWGQYEEDLKTQRPVAVIDGKIKWKPIDVALPIPDDKPFSERLRDMERKNQLLQLQNQAQTTQYQFLEDVVTELILTTMP